MRPRPNTRLILIVIALFICVGVLQHVADPIRAKMIARAQKINGGGGELMVQLPGQFLIASVAGFREVIAGALWVRADTFFHTGRYQAIIPIVRLVTWLDPHNIDVYTTGAWHLDYNFVDQQQMSDKRYIPGAIALLKEGIANNPDIWDLYFELGWTHYNKKLMDYKKAAYYIEKATKLSGFDANTGRKTDRPDFVDHMLAHTYEKVGRFDKSAGIWKDCRARVEKMMKAKHHDVFTDKTSLDVIDRNLSLMQLRRGWRYGDMDAYADGIRIITERHDIGYAEWAIKAAVADYNRRKAANSPPRDALKPLNTGFEVTWKRAAPKQFLIKGKINLVPISEYKDLASECFTHRYEDEFTKANANMKQFWKDGCRVFWRLEDYDYKMEQKDTFDWKIDTSKMCVWDSIYVSGGRFSQLINLSDPRDADMYPFKAKRYKLTIWWSPSDPTPDYIQDRIGWKGEAVVDKPELIDRKSVPGMTQIRKEYILTREQLL